MDSQTRPAIDRDRKVVEKGQYREACDVSLAGNTELISTVENAAGVCIPMPTDSNIGRPGEVCSTGNYDIKSHVEFAAGASSSIPANDFSVVMSPGFRVIEPSLEIIAGADGTLPTADPGRPEAVLNTGTGPVHALPRDFAWIFRRVPRSHPRVLNTSINPPLDVSLDYGSLQYWMDIKFGYARFEEEEEEEEEEQIVFDADEEYKNVPGDTKTRA